MLPLLLAGETGADEVGLRTGDLVTLKTALSDGTVEVLEVDGGGHVPTLRVLNRGDRALLLLDGEELVGAKQDRVLNASVLVEAGDDLQIPVSCVEQGRWHRRSRGFASRGRSMPAEMRRAKTERVSLSLSTHDSYDAGQRRVWRDVERYALRRSVRTPTSALGDVFEADLDELGRSSRDLRPVDRQVGVAAWLDGQLFGVEVLCSPELFAEAFDRISHSYVAEVLGRRSPRDRKAAEEVGLPSVRELLRRIGEQPIERHASPGLGVDLRSQGRAGTASLLFDETSRLVHAVVYARG